MFPFVLLCFVLLPALPLQADEIINRALQEALRRYSLVTETPTVYRATLVTATQPSTVTKVEELPKELQELTKGLEGIVPVGPWVQAVSDKVAVFTAGEFLVGKGKGLKQLDIHSVSNDDGNLTVVVMTFHKGALKENADVVNQFSKRVRTTSRKVRIVVRESE